jgi:hypothetical protein
MGASLTAWGEPAWRSLVSMSAATSAPYDPPYTRCPVNPNICAHLHVGVRRALKIHIAEYAQQRSALGTGAWRCSALISIGRCLEGS